MTDFQRGTDWVMLGAPTPEGRVAIYASTKLGQAELVRETERDWYTFHRPEQQHFELTVEMRSYVIVVGDTYPDALRRLFETWTPKAGERPVLEPAQRAVEAGWQP